MQRVRVGVIGLAAVIALIGLASLLFSGVRRERAERAPNGVVASANMAADAAANVADEPLADLGVAPGSASVDNAAAGQGR